MSADSLVRPIKRIELIADQEGLFQIYLFELTSITIAHTRALARAFRNRAGNYLLVLASDYEHLDFVLLERYLPSGSANGSTLGQRQVGIRPHVLTIDRRKPSRLDLRVLRRLTWTESDAFAQYDKLLSAYAVADWSEEFFNNKQGLKPKPDSKADLIGRELVDTLFELKILDPAMGSGHFLVEAVDYITDKALDFLNAFPWNPVFAHLAQMRHTILQEMDDQGITIDPKRLTDVNLLKRHVLKRCVYEVDLNPMAVELAKVSLWLDCFTLGAPLSFLDHHLRCGNSLIGVTVKEVREGLEHRYSNAKCCALAFPWSYTSLKYRGAEVTFIGKFLLLNRCSRR